MRAIKQLFGETLLYGISSILGRAINYLLVPLYTTVFSLEAYGMVTEFYAYVAFGTVFYTYGLELAYFRFANQQEEPTLFNTLFSWLLTSSLLFSGLLSILAPYITKWFNFLGYENYIYYFATILAIDTILVLPFAQLRFKKKTFLFISIKLVQVILTLILNCLFIYNIIPTWLSALLCPPSIGCVFIANMISNFTVLLLFIPSLSHVRIVFFGKKMRGILQYAFPLFLMHLATTINAMCARSLLRYLLPVHKHGSHSISDTVGVFGACYKLAILISLGLQAFQYAAEPFFFAHTTKKEGGILLSQVMHLFIIFACFGLLILSLNLDLLGSLFLRREAYRTGIEIVPYLGFSYILLGIYYNLTIWFKHTQKTRYGVGITIAGALVTLILNFYLIPCIGYWGAVWAAIGSAMTMVLLCFYYGNKHYPIPYQWKKGSLCLVTTLVLIKLIRSIPHSSFTTGIITSLLLSLLFALLFWFLIRKWWIK